MACIYCGGSSPADYDNLTEPEPTAEDWAEFHRRHGRGKYCDPCDWCRQGVPHQPHVCANGTGIPRRED
jgi:hypothetical protein